MHRIVSSFMLLYLIVMIHEYKSASQLMKIFIWLSIGLVLAFIAVYSFELYRALNMDPQSFNCLHDSMMKQICRDPYGSSITWALVGFGFFGHPFIIAWVVIGVVLLTRSEKISSLKNQR